MERSETVDETNDQEQGGSLFDTVLGKGKEYLSDPQHQEQLMGQARERFGNVPGMDQVGGMMGQGAERSESEASISDRPSGSFEETGQGYGERGESGDAERYPGEEPSTEEDQY